MKICWDNLNKLIYRNNYWFDERRHKYIYVDNCEWCKQPFITRCDGTLRFCSKSCSSKYFNTGKIPSMETRMKMSKSQKKRHLGIVKRNLPLYDTFANKIKFVEPVRPVFKQGIKLLEVKCKKCKSWFMPTRDAVKGRYRALYIGDNGSCNFYCSDECKWSCNIYGQTLYPKNFKNNKNYSTYELSIWANEVLKRANYKCEYCGEKATDAHHIKPQKLEPFFALDPDYGIACCEKCHYKYGHVGECSTGSLARRICI